MQVLNELSDEQNQEINKKLVESLHNYKKTMAYMLGDAPIETLCLPKATQKLLISAGCLRVYDLFDCDFTKIEGFSDVTIRDLTSRVNQFLSMC